MTTSSPPVAVPPDKLSVVIFSGEFDRIHYALVMASAAAAIGKAVTLFFTMEACRALVRPDSNGEPGWRTLTAERAKDAGTTDDLYRAGGIAGFEELLEACVSLDARFIVCEMGLRAAGLDHATLREDLPLEVAGVVTLLEDASRNGLMLFI